MGKHTIEKYKRKSVFVELKQFCLFADENHYIEITEWKNGEGFDIDINSKTPERFQLTWGEFDAIKALLKKIK